MQPEQWLQWIQELMRRLGMTPIQKFSITEPLIFPFGKDLQLEMNWLPDGEVQLRADLGRPVQEDDLMILEELLKSHLRVAQEGPLTLGIEGEKGHVVLARRLLGMWDSKSFFEAVEQFINHADLWQEILRKHHEGEPIG